MNLLESGDFSTFDIAQLRSASDKPRVLFITNPVLGWPSFAGEIARATAKRSDIYAVHATIPTGGPARRALSQIAVRVRPIGQRHHAMVRSRAKSLTRMLEFDALSDSVDVIHVTPHLAALGVVQSKWRGPLSVLFDASVRDAKGQRQSLSRSSVQRTFHAMLRDERRIVNGASQLWATSRWAATGMAADYDLDPTAIRILPPVRTGVPRAWPATETTGPVRIAFVGNDLERKGGRRLVEWHQKHWRDVAELHLFTGAANPFGPLPGVTWHHGVSTDSIVTQQLPTMDLLVLPTRSDMAPFAVSEAVATGLPVVSSAIGGIVELVQDGVTGLLLQPDDDAGFIRAIERLFDYDTRATMGRAALAFAGEYLDPDRVLTEFVDEILACSLTR